MGTSLRVLILEDNPSDAELMLHALRRAGYEPSAVRLETEREFLDNLQPAPEIILADFSMPEFGALQALEILQERRLDVPIIVVSGTIGEERAAQVMQCGATDYLMKDRLGRLGQAIANALEKKRLRDETKLAGRRLMEQIEELEHLYRLAPVGLALLDSSIRIVRINERAAVISGMPIQDQIGRTLAEIMPQLAGELETVVNRVFATGQPVLDFEIHVVAAANPANSRDWLTSYYPVKSSDGITRYVGMMIQDITEREKADVALRKAKDNADAASRAKSEFLAHMSHEIRTPMNGILGMTELLMGTPISTEQSEYLGMVKQSADALLKIINDILDFSKIEAGKMALDLADFHIRETVGQVVKILALAAHAKNLHLSLHIAADVPDALHGDAARLRQIIINVVGNAIKFTERGEVVVRIQLQSQTTGEVELHGSVVDSGIGIPRDKHAKLFQAFQQVDGSDTRRHGGTGLGLVIAQRLVQLMGGRIWFESEPSRGTTFHFVVSMGLGRNAAPVLPPLDHAELTDASALLVNGKVRLQPPARLLHILLAEDQPINQRLAVRMLEKRGHSVVVANNGREAINSLARESFDLVIMDVQMPEMDGFEATRSIRLQEKDTGRHLPIVAMTAYAIKGDRERCLAAGCDDYLSKPIDSSSLYEVVERLGTCASEFRAGEAMTAAAAEPIGEEWNRTAALARVNGDEAFLRELVELFLLGYPVLMTDLESAIRERDASAIIKAVHTLNGNVGSLGAIASCNHLHLIEEQAKTGELNHGIERLLAETQRRLNAFIETLQKFLAEPASGRTPELVIASV